MRLKRFVIAILCVISSLYGSARIIEWCVAPEYDEIKPYAAGLYMCSKNGKWGLISSVGKLLQQPQYDFIMPLQGGYAIAGIGDGYDYRITGIIDKEGRIVSVNGQYYIANNYYTYFSEGLLPVKDSSGKQGFINTQGFLVVKCKFGEVHPFSYGLASVKDEKGRAGYIKKNDPKSVIYKPELNNGFIAFASTFHEGKAVVSVHGKAEEINTQLKKISSYNGDLTTNELNHKLKSVDSESAQAQYFVPKEDTLIKSFAENGLYGYKDTYGIAVYPYFSLANPFNQDGCAIVSVNGKMGLLKQSSGGTYSSFIAKKDESTSLKTSLDVSRKGVIEACDYRISVPIAIDASKLEVRMTCGDGVMKKCDFENIGNGNLKISFTPHAESKADVFTVKADVEYDGLPVYKFSQSIGLKYPKALVVSVPNTVTDKADSNDRQVIRAVIKNDSNEDVELTATLEIPSKLDKPVSELITVPAWGSKPISAEVIVTEEQQVTAKVSLSTGETKTNRNVILRPYY